jgi:threonine dehydrogenase-like Zn-dependent dehydrogenase
MIVAADDRVANRQRFPILLTYDAFSAHHRFANGNRKSPMTDVIVVIGAGSIGQAIARRISAGKRVLLADLSQQNADAAAKVLDVGEPI